MKPDNPIVYNEFYLDVMTGGSSELPAPVTPEQHYLAHLAGMEVTLPHPIILRDMFLAKICGMDVNVPTYIPGKFPQKFAYYAKAAEQDVDVPQPITREEMYWFDYVGGQPAPSEREYTGAVPVTFTADGTPLLDLLISGNTVQSGTPAPDSPIMPQGTGERTGNLFNKKSLNIINNRYLRYNGELDVSSNHIVSDFMLISGTHITISNTPVDNTTSQCFYDDNKNFISSFKLNEIPKTIEIPSNAKFIRCTVPKIRRDDFMLNLGSTPLPYEPYGYKLDISSANTTAPVYLGEVETTRRVKKLVLTGEENWNENTSGANTFRGRLPLTQAQLPLTEGYCTHTTFLKIGVSADTVLCGIVNNYLYLRLSRTIANTLDEFKSYLAAQYANGTPVTVWYVLATPQTAVVNEPLMKIGDYADTVSMEQAGAQIPTANGSTTLDVETTVKPSEVYIKYRGEAVATLSALPAEVSSTEATTEEENPEEMEEEENGSEDISLQHEFEAIE